jgi:amino-acid N-acetyltransferase
VDVTIRRARTSDVPAIRGLVEQTRPGRLLSKSTVTLYEDIQEFWVAEIPSGQAADPAAGPPEEGATGANTAGAEPAESVRNVAGCGALHVMWEDLAEVRTLAVDPARRGIGVGHRIVDQLLKTARELGVRRVFCLTFEVAFFAQHGFRPIRGTPVSNEVYDELLRSYDEGVAEFLDLDRVKPNTLGNTRMLLHLEESK